MEIERKFRVRKVPENLEQYERKQLEQGYLCINPVVRVRKTVKEGETTYLLCYKSKIGLELNADAKARVHVEEELPLLKESYDLLFSKIEGRPIRKKRYLIPYRDYVIELDVFEGELSGLVFAEVEFPDEEETASFVIPDWFAEDVTFDERFRNNWLAMDDEAVNEMKRAGFFLRKEGKINKASVKFL